VGAAFAQTTPTPASDADIQTVKQLAKAGYLGDKKDLYLSAKSLTANDVVDALLKINDQIMKIDMKTFDPDQQTYQLADLQTLLKLTQDRAADIRARKASAWKLENRLQKMITILTPEEETETEPETAAVTPVPSPTPTVVAPTATATPIPGPSREEWTELKQSLKDLNKKTVEMQDAYEIKLATSKKVDDDIKLGNSDIQEQLKLVKKLLDRVQEDLKKSEDRFEGIEEKVKQKLSIDIEMQQELKVMRKDLRDNTEDVSVLKKEVAKLDKTDSLQNQNPIDDFLGSKWVAGGALVIGLTALTISLTR
jgi:hypothetical protein